MKIQPLSLSCACGLAPAQITRVGLTADHQLVINWLCTGCGMDVHVVKALSDCWRDCPEAEPVPEVSEFSEARLQQTDEEFLHSLGVKFAD